MRNVGIAVALWVLCTQFAVDAKWVWSLPSHTVNPPFADVGGAALLLLLPWLWSQRVPLMAPGWAIGFLLVAMVSVWSHSAELSGMRQIDSLWWVVRNPIFLYGAYAVALPAALQEMGAHRLRRVVWGIVAAVAVLSVVTSVGRIMGGDGAWWMAIPFVTPNHKTLAVWLAPWVPWLWHYREEWGASLLAGLVAVAILLSGSKAALLVALLGWAWIHPVAGRPLVTRVWLTGAVGLGALFVAVASPSLFGSSRLADAADSRHSLTIRATAMFQEAPIVGLGPGSFLGVRTLEEPHERVNGVDAHGVVQKVGAELGIAGLITWGGFTALVLLRIRRRWDGDFQAEEWALLGVGVCLHINLLASTEAFTMTHWIPLGVVWGQVHRAAGRAQ